MPHTSRVRPSGSQLAEPPLRIRGRLPQRLGILVLRVQDHLVRGPSLHHLPLVEHQDVIAEVAGGGQIMSDVENPEILLPL